MRNPKQKTELFTGSSKNMMLHIFNISSRIWTGCSSYTMNVIDVTRITQGSRRCIRKSNDRHPNIPDINTLEEGL